MSDSNVIQGRFRDPKPPTSATIGLDLLQQVERRADGPWLVVYLSGRKVGEVPLEPGTEPDLRLADVIPITGRE